MYLGIKVGPDNWREKLLDGLRVQHVEIYHDFDLADDYRPLYAWLRANGVHARLHASTPLPGDVMATLGTSDPAVRKASVALHKRTIDVAAENGFDGVVVHSGAYLIARIRRGRVEVIGPDTSPQEGRRWLREALEELAEYGRARGVEPLIENMPGREFAGYGPMDRSYGVDVRFVSHQTLRELGQAGFSLCVDLAHLYTELMMEESANGLHGRVRDAAVLLAPYARHAHLSTVAPPWNGTDGHSGFLASDYALGAVPDREQLCALLEPFSETNVWLIPEPMGGPEVHLANYRQLAEWLEDTPPLNPPRTAHGGEDQGASSRPPAGIAGEGRGVSSPSPAGFAGEGRGVSSPSPAGFAGEGRGGGLC